MPLLALRRGRFAAQLLVLLTLFSAGLTPALAATATPSPAGIVRIADDAVVTRGDFIRSAIKALDIAPVKKGTLPASAGRVALGLRPYVLAAQQRGALSVFGASLDLRQTITRGEAVAFLAAMQPELKVTTPAPDFSDVRGKEQERAVSLALELQWMKAQTGNTFGWARPLKGKEATLILQRVARSGGTTITVPIIKQHTPTGQVPKQDIQRSVWEILNEEYLYDDRIDEKAAGDASIQGLVKTLNDPYTQYLPKNETENFNTQIRGEVEGIGANVVMTGGVVVIVSPLKGSPAEKAGILPKDQVLSADGVLLSGMSLDEAVSRIRGPKGTQVKLRLRRDGVELDITVTRDTVRIPEIEVSTQEGVVILKISQFGEITDSDIRAKLRDIEAGHPRGLILDLRNNPGGLLHAAGVVAGSFLPEDSVYVTIASRQSTTQERTGTAPLISPSVKMVVLVNGGSASASEIVAGALQDAGRAVIVGEKTFGKGTVQQVVRFSDGSSLKLTIAEWKTPQGRKIDGVGVMPDEVVTNVTGRDDQLNRAVQMLR